jgi:hypothetical protein
MPWKIKYTILTRYFAGALDRGASWQKVVFRVK